MDLSLAEPESLKPLIDAVVLQSSHEMLLVLLQALAQKTNSSHLEDFSHLSKESLATLGDSLQLVSFYRAILHKACG